MTESKSWNRDITITVFLILMTAYWWYMGMMEAPVDRIQGDVYRIIFVHVPVAGSAFLTALWLLVAALAALIKKSERWLCAQKACVEVGLIFTMLTLATGSIWGRPTWGTWWTWDARLTTTMILALMQASYLLLYASSEAGPHRLRICSILAILITIDVPIIYKSVTWWRTLHQPAVLFTRDQSQAMSADITNILLPALFTMMAFTTWLIWLRQKNIVVQADIEAQSMAQLS